MHREKPLITVIGSYAVGMTMSASRFPLPGETVLGRGFQQLHGGKGSNQAIAVARMGGNPLFVSGVGADGFGAAALAMLQHEKVDTTFVKQVRDFPTGVGFVIVDDATGNNEIVIDFGANNAVFPEDIEELEHIIAKSEIVLLQLEINRFAVERAIDVASELRKTIILNPAPYQALPESILKKVTYLIPNETEASMILNTKPGKENGKSLAAMLRERFGLSAIVTLGENGAFLCTDTCEAHIPGIPVKAIDTTGAGDTFCGAFAVSLSEGKPLWDAVAFANRAAALSVTKAGVVPSIPYRHEVEQFQGEPYDEKKQNTE